MTPQRYKVGDKAWIKVWINERDEPREVNIVAILGHNILFNGKIRYIV